MSSLLAIVAATFVAGCVVTASDAGLGAGGSAGFGGDGSVGPTTGAGGAPAADCSGVCAKAASANCTNQDTTTCVDQCNQVTSQATNCQSQLDGYLYCADNSGIFECDAEGHATLTNCQSELGALMTCLSTGTCSTGSSGTGGSGPAPTDVAGSAECQSWCAKLAATCGTTCDPQIDCAIESGQCAASTQAYLACQVQTGQWYCGADGSSIVSNCQHDTSVCSGGGGTGGPVCSGIPATPPSGGSCFPSSPCNPVTNEGCTDGSACDAASSGFSCYPPPNDAALCGACDNSVGPFCGGGMTCLNGQCVHYCCSDEDCGCGTCTQMQVGTGTAGVCMN